MTHSTIRIDRLSVFGHHGVLPEETRLGQNFLIDLVATVETWTATQNDDYRAAVCYAALCDHVVALVAGEPVQLIETLADRIAEALLAAFPTITRLTIRVNKPAAPIPHPFGMVSVETTRERFLPVGFSLGCNMGDRESALSMAVTWLGVTPGVKIEAVSGLYRTAPFGGVEQPDFYNLCVTGRSALEPLALLRVCKEIESRLGRVPGQRWGQRAMDVDLLYLGDQVVEAPVLTLPHRGIAERAFVLVPLAEIAPEQKISGLSVSDMLIRLPREADDVVPCAERLSCIAEDLK
ncbi:folate biosynthesis protein [Asaia sp. W19]|uniref:2-amino-4-hydroxy-6- hydroxymethyldihydropteridine diphosphokinase n=1 Tax=unclassified Asaia TaxID=2685023 RepID=UPI000F8D731D|nr:2-amino-4-hydroxy-6-hydroxymethyldihydropteridine diphosphokinase [Asaia sp. W19]RUT24346.1 folate biosynthesis protein [Asaia sp. W19]